MRERCAGALAGVLIIAIAIFAARFANGTLAAAAVIALVGWGVGGYIWRLRWLAEHDELTGLKNRRPFERTLRREWDRAAKEGHPLSLLFMDADDFGLVNKQHGHLMGDKVLRTICRQMRKAVRDSDCMARWGGEEFVVVLPKASLEQAVRVAERIRSKVSESTVRDGSTAIRVTISVGVATARESMNCSSELLREAVHSQMRAKAQKNAVEVAAFSM